MTVQRYVFRYGPRSAAWFEDNWGIRADSRTDPEGMADAWNEAFAGTYEKEGGGYTRELSEAKLIGWRSKRFSRRDDGDLIPARITLDA